MSIRCRGIRGATTAAENSPEAIVEATRELLQAMIAANGVQPEDVASAFFTTTPDLSAAFPARAARQLGWGDVALLGAQEMAAPEQPARCIRILIHWNTALPQASIRHVYMQGAEALRPDRSSLDAEQAEGPAPLAERNAR